MIAKCPCCKSRFDTHDTPSCPDCRFGAAILGVKTTPEEVNQANDGDDE